MKKLTILAFMLAQSVAVSSFAAPVFNMKSESSASESSGPEGTVQTVVNASFAFTNLYNPQKQNFTDILLAQKIEASNSSGKESAPTKLETTAWMGGKNRYDTKMWTISDCADSGWRGGDFYLTSKYGGEGAENMLRAYNFRTGKYAFSYTTEPVAADIYIPKDVIKRHVAYVSKKGASSACRKNEMPQNVVGALALSDGDAQIDRIVLEAESEEMTRSPKIALVSEKEPKGANYLSIWGPAEFANRSDVVKGFSVKVTFQDGTDVIIPVTNDKFDIQKAVLPKTVKLRRVDVEKTDGGK